MSHEQRGALFFSWTGVAAIIVIVSFGTPAVAGLIEDLHAQTPTQSIALRAPLMRAIWGTEKLAAVPVHREDTPTNINVFQTFGREPRETGWLISKMGHLKARTLYAKFPAADCLFVVNAGHGQGFVQPPPADLKLNYWSGPGSVEFLKRLAASNCDLVMSSMPLYGENRYYALDEGLPMERPGGDLHNDMPNVPDLRPVSGSLLQYYLDPALGSLSWMLASKSYRRVGMGGLSGGGWTTTLLAAIDPRIQASYAVAGSLPVKAREKSDAGDWEQTTRNLLSVADYSDLYLMGAADRGRRVRLYYNEMDSCCFKGANVREFAPDLLNFAKLNGYGSMEVFIAPGSEHDIGQAIADRILADFLN